jgi:LysM repeat protein
VGTREKLARFAAPAAFLAALTIAVLLIRSGLGGSGATTKVTTPAKTAAATTRAATTVRTSTASTPTTTTGASFYLVQRGDTYGSIATRYGISVQRLESLNPGVSSNSLSIGQKIRVK